MIYQPFVTRRSSSQNQFVPEIVSPLPCSSYITVCLFFQKLISFIGSLDKCHTSVFDALVSYCRFNQYSQDCRKFGKTIIFHPFWQFDPGRYTLQMPSTPFITAYDLLWILLGYGITDSKQKKTISKQVAWKKYCVKHW